MKTIETTQVAGPDKLLHVTIPVDEADRLYRMVILLAPEGEAIAGRRVGMTEWPPGYFENVCGSIQDETFVRHPQPEDQERPDPE